MSLYQQLSEIQKKIVSPKGRTNDFGGFDYRKAEDILMALKPLLPDGVVVTTSDSIVLVAQRIYVKATATITDGKESISTDAYAREVEVKKGMDDAQVTGACSSYARKRALEGLLAIDGNDDPDVTNKEHQAPQSLTVEQTEDLTKAAKTAGYDLSAALEYYKVKSLADVPAVAYTQIQRAIQKHQTEAVA